MSDDSKTNTVADKLRMAFSHFTLLLTIGFGAVTVLTLLEEPSRTLPTNFTAVVQPNQAGSRAPASAGVGDGAQVSTMATLDIECGQRDSHPTKALHVRIRGVSCRETAATVVRTLVKNETNGFVATVFTQDNQSFTTDYVSLVPGVNQIVVESELADGQKSQREVIVVRE